MNAFVAMLLADTNWNHMGWGPGGWILMGIGMVLFWGLVIFGVVWLVRTLTAAGHHAHAPHQLTPLEILDRGLADGSISVEEYRERRRLLTGERSEH